MVTTAFSDEIVNATELRKQQAHWLNKAKTKPVTITYGSSKLTILNRDKIRDLYLQNSHLERALKYCNEFADKKKSSVFPWIDYLDVEERIEFYREYLNTITLAIITEDWDNVETLIYDWKATAETEHDTRASKAVKERVKKSDYIAIK